MGHMTAPATPTTSTEVGHDTQGPEPGNDRTWREFIIVVMQWMWAFVWGGFNWGVWALSLGGVQFT